MVSEPATMARREFDAITLRWDVVPNSVASSFTVRQCLVRPVAKQTKLTR